MNPAHSYTELQAMLQAQGWTLHAIKQTGQVFVAKGESPGGEKLERNGSTPEMALANLINFARRHNQIRQLSGPAPRVAAWSSHWGDLSGHMAQAYRKLPVYDHKAAEHWRSLGDESRIQADEIRKQIRVEVVPQTPYRSADEMRYDMHHNRHLYVTGGDHPVWSPEEVADFRTVHNVLGYGTTDAQFDWHGQNKATAAHMPHVSEHARQALLPETVGHAAHFQEYRSYGPQRIGLMSDFLHPAQRVEGEHLYVPHTGVPAMTAPNQPGQWLQSTASSHFEIGTPVQIIYADGTNTGQSGKVVEKHTMYGGSYTVELRDGKRVWAMARELRPIPEIDEVPDTPASLTGDTPAQMDALVRHASQPKGASVDPNRDWKPEIPHSFTAPPIDTHIMMDGNPHPAGPQDGPEHDYIERQKVEANAHNNIPRYNGKPWWEPSVPKEVQDEAILNAFKLAILSPQKHLKWNAAHYQAIADMPAHTPAHKLYERLDTERRRHNEALGHDPDAHQSYHKETTLLAKRLMMHDTKLSPSEAEADAKRRVQEMRVEAEHLFMLQANKHDVELDPLSVEVWVHRVVDHWLKGTLPEHPTKKVPLKRPTKDRTHRVVKRAPSEIRDPLKRLWQHPEVFPKRPHYRVNEPAKPKVEMAADPGMSLFSSWRTADQMGMDFGWNKPNQDILPDASLYQGDEAAPKGDARPEAKYGMFYSQHLRDIANIGQHIDELREAALKDIREDGGRGFHFRNTVMNLGVGGANAKVASFVWLMLSPMTSDLGVLDTHMARVFGVPESSLSKPKEYYKFERMQKTAKDATGYRDMPLGLYHWGLWDLARTPDPETGKPQHSDHQSLRPLDPLDWRKVKWESSVMGGSVTPFQDPEHFARARPLMAQVAADYDKQFAGQPQGRAPEIQALPQQHVVTKVRRLARGLSGLPKSATCKHCSKSATHAVIWAEGRAFVPCCEDHIDKAKASIEDPTDIDSVSEVGHWKSAAGDWVPVVGDKVILKPGLAQSMGIKPKDPRWEADMDSYPEGEIVEIMPASHRPDGSMGWPLFKIQGPLINGLLVRQEQVIPVGGYQRGDETPQVPDTLPAHWSAWSLGDDPITDKVQLIVNNTADMARRLHTLIQRGSSAADLAEAFADVAVQNGVDPNQVNWQRLWEHEVNAIREDQAITDQTVPDTLPAPEWTDTPAQSESLVRHAADEWDHPEAWEGAREQADEWADNIGPKHPNWNQRAWTLFEQQLHQGRSGIDAYNAVLAALLEEGLTTLEATKGAKEAWMHWLQVQEDMEDQFDAKDGTPMDQPGLDTAPLPPQWMKLTPSQQSQLQNVPKRQGAERKPDHIFVYYMGELLIEDWHHNRKYTDMLDDLLKSHGLDISSMESTADLDETDVAAGEVFVYADGGVRIEMKQLAKPEVQEQARIRVYDRIVGLNDNSPAQEDEAAVAG